MNDNSHQLLVKPNHDSTEKNLKQSEIDLIKSWNSENISISEIANRIKRSPATIRRFLWRKKQHPSTPIKKKSGPKSRLDKVDLGVLKRYISTSPFSTVAEARLALPHNLSKVSIRTVRRTLVGMGFPSRRAAKKPVLTKKMKLKRMQFALKYKHWTAADWMKVMFSDESTFKCFRSSGYLVRRPDDASRYDPKFTSKTVKHPASVMVWGCFSGTVGRGGIYFLPPKTTMNAERYCTVLKDHLIPFMRIHEAKFFLHDSAPCHKAKIVQNLLKDQVSFQVIEDWPGNSPDLNPIENVWSFMKNQLKYKDTGSVPKLIHELKMLWKEPHTTIFKMWHPLCQEDFSL